MKRATPTDAASCALIVLRRNRGVWMTTREIADATGFTFRCMAIQLPKIRGIKRDERVRPTKWRIGMRTIEIMEAEIFERLTSEAIAGEPVHTATMREVLLRVRVAFDVLALHGAQAARDFLAGADRMFWTIPLQQQGADYATVGFAQLRDAIDSGLQYGSPQVTSAVADLRRAYALRRLEE